MLRCLLRRNEQRGRLLQLLRCSVTSRNIAASAPSGGEAQNVHVTSAAGWAVAKTRVLAEAGYLGIAAKVRRVCHVCCTYVTITRLRC